MTSARLGSATPRAALLCDRDGTLVVDVPYNADPDAVVPLLGVAEALDRARAAGLLVGIVSNQRGVALGRITPAQLLAVNGRVEALLGPFDVVVCCPHGADDGCGCRKPEPGLVRTAADALDVPAASCVVVGDSWSDVVAARRAGAQPVLVGDRPPPDGESAVWVPDLAAAVDLVLAGRRAA